MKTAEKREREKLEKDEGEDETALRTDDDVEDFFFDEDEPNPGDRRRDPLRRPSS